MDSSGRTAQEDLAKQKSLPKTFIIQAEPTARGYKDGSPTRKHGVWDCC
ncbi:MAG: hypothetical protein MR534_07375 [Prevotellaceae bacterium]|nr:hypothetical protein [Prevotellaceae bacterium]